MLYAILQPFKIDKVHTDNGSAFRALGFLEVMSALGITVINSSALSPRGRGSVEKRV
jgi:transposase InsO family protein